MARIEEDVALDRGDGMLSGTLVCPGPPGGPHTVVLILAGSGPTDRDGNGPALGLHTDFPARDS